MYNYLDFINKRNYIMAKLHFFYGTMGSSKTAQALMTKFNYEQKGFNVFLIKPIIDNRNTENNKIVVKSRIGLSSPCNVFEKTDNLISFITNKIKITNRTIIIVDEVQFCTKIQIDQLHKISEQIPVLCYGLLTNFKTELFEGSKRLVEISESLNEISAVCSCGEKATVNARFINNKLVSDGEEILIGAEEFYKSMCYSCYDKLKNGN